MPEEKNPDTAVQDELSKKFDEVVVSSAEAGEDTSQDTSDGIVIDVRRDPSELDSKSELKIDTPSAVVESIEQPTKLDSSVVPAPRTPRSSGATMVLQWLSYAFWGWFAAAMGWLAAVTISYFVVGNTSATALALAYPLASVIVMLLVAMATDMCYARREPEQKSGGSNVIMLIHVVIFILITVASVVTAMFALISMLLNTDPMVGTDGQLIALWTSLIVGVMFAMIATRALVGGKRKVVRRLHWTLSGGFALGLIALSIAGPAMGAQLTRDDRLLEEGLPALSQAVANYVSDKGKLPATLGDAQDVSIYTANNAAANTIVARNLVQYTPNTKPAGVEGNDTTYSYSYGTTHYYKMCVQYKQAKKANDTYSSPDMASEGKYSMYLMTEVHDKGEVCYSLKAVDGYVTYPVDDVIGPNASGASSTIKQ